MYYGLGCNCDAESALAGLGVGGGMNMDPKQAASGEHWYTQLLDPAAITAIGTQVGGGIKTFGETQAAIRLARAGLITGGVPDAAKHQDLPQRQPQTMSNTTMLLIGAGVLVGGILLVGMLSRK